MESFHANYVASGRCYTALERTLFYGQPSPEAQRFWNINVAVHLPDVNARRVVSADQ